MFVKLQIEKGQAGSPLNSLQTIDQVPFKVHFQRGPGRKSNQFLLNDRSSAFKFPIQKRVCRKSNQFLINDRSSSFLTSNPKGGRPEVRGTKGDAWGEVAPRDLDWAGSPL